VARLERVGKTVHLLFTRNVGECLFHTKSTDEGKTWSKLVGMSDSPKQKEYKKDNFLKGFGGSPVGIGAGPVHGIQLESGRLIAPSYIGRVVNGKREGNCTTIYSDMAITKNGRILCVFENGVNDYCEKISVVEVDRKWLVAGKVGREEDKPVSASFCGGFYSLSALNDRREPKNSADQSIPRFAWWNHLGTTEWVQYRFPSPRKVSAVEVYWYVNRACQAPKSWRLLFLSGKEWKEVSGASKYGTEADKYNRVTFKPVETTALRLEARLKPKLSGGILEWKVETAK